MELECPKLTYTARISEWIDQVAPNKKDQIPRSHPLFNFLNEEIATNCPSSVEVFNGGKQLV